jgi:glycosyltransferase involved in cell wall biosynthesis
MNIAFYAPLKAPSHPVPSGDREIARAFMSAFELGGNEVCVASTFRSREGEGDRGRQQTIEALGQRLARRALRRIRTLPDTAKPHVWFTYHHYHKSPDFIGPTVATALNIPYVIAEASFAPKHSTGPWAQWNVLSRQIIARADGIVAMNSDDIAGLEPLLGDHQTLVRWPPFIDERRYASHNPDVRTRLAKEHALALDRPWLLCVAMMRPGRKADSFALLARALRGIEDQPWCLLVAGDGEARDEVQHAFRAFGAERVCFLGEQTPQSLPALYGACDLFVWPALGEPLGLVFLEAQACGLPVVAGTGRGVGDLIEHERTGLLAPEGDVDAFATNLRRLIGAPQTRAEMGGAAVEHIRRTHGLALAAKRLSEFLCSLAGRA